MRIVKNLDPQHPILVTRHGLDWAAMEHRREAVLAMIKFLTKFKLALGFDKHWEDRWNGFLRKCVGRLIAHWDCAGSLEVLVSPDRGWHAVLRIDTFTGSTNEWKSSWEVEGHPIWSKKDTFLLSIFCGNKYGYDQLTTLMRY